MLRGLPRIVLANVLLFVALVGVLELGARLFVARDLRAVFNDPEMFVRGRPFIVPHPVRGFALVPGFHNDTYNINASGFRGPELPDDWRERSPVVAMGASSVFGWRVGDRETWPYQVQARLGDEAIVINAAVPSYTSAQTRLYLDELLERVHPSVVLVDALWNDALFACLDNWMPELLVRQQPARWRQILLRRSALYRAFALKPRDAVHQPLTPNGAALDFFHENMIGMIRSCKRRGIPIALVQPTIQLTLLSDAGMKIGPRTVPREFFAELLEAFSRELEAVASQTGVALVRHPLTIGSTAADSLFFDPAHPTSEGHTLVANEIATVLATMQPSDGVE